MVIKSRKTALLAGISGQVGSEILKILLSDDNYSRIIAPVRNRVPVAHAKLKQAVVDFDNLEVYANLFNSDVVFLCLGTSSKDHKEFEKVDFNYSYKIAKLASQNGANTVLYISGLGANPKSKHLYMRVKGRAENALQKLPYKAIHIFRPAMMYGSKDSERKLQLISKVTTKLFSFLLVGPFKKYRAVSAQNVAKTMALCCDRGKKGIHYYESDTIQHIAGQISKHGLD